MLYRGVPGTAHRWVKVKTPWFSTMLICCQFWGYFFGLVWFGLIFCSCCGWWEYEILCFDIFIISLRFYHVVIMSEFTFLFFVLWFNYMKISLQLYRISSCMLQLFSKCSVWRKTKRLCVVCAVFFWLWELLLVSSRVCVFVCVIMLWGGCESMNCKQSPEMLIGFMTEEGCKSDCGSPHRGKGYQLPSAHIPRRERETGTDGLLDTCTWTSSWQTCLWHQWTEAWVKWFKANTPTLLRCQQVCLTN